MIPLSPSDHFPRDLLAAVIVGRHGAHDLDREAVAEVAPLDLLVTQPKVHA